MSIRATNFIRTLRGLNFAERAASFVLADHANHKTGEITISMTTLAVEAEFAHRQSASEVMGRLVAWKVFLAPNPSKGGRPTTLFVNYDLAESDSPVKVASLDRNQPVAVNRNSPVAVEEEQPQPGTDSTAIENSSNRNCGIAGRVLEGERQGKISPYGPPMGDANVFPAAIVEPDSMRHRCRKESPEEKMIRSLRICILRGLVDANLLTLFFDTVKKSPPFPPHRSQRQMLASTLHNSMICGLRTPEDVLHEWFKSFPYG